MKVVRLSVCWRLNHRRKGSVTEEKKKLNTNEVRNVEKIKINGDTRRNVELRNGWRRTVELKRLGL
jgi:hypothetical protein